MAIDVHIVLSIRSDVDDERRFDLLQHVRPLRMFDTMTNVLGWFHYSRPSCRVASVEKDFAKRMVSEFFIRVFTV